VAKGGRGSGADAVRAYFRAWNERRMQDAVNVFGDDCVYEDTLYSGKFEGKEALKAHLFRCDRRVEILLTVMGRL
jgi:hypothetical protein